MKNWNLLLGLVIAGCFVFVGYEAVKEGLIYEMTVAEKIDGKLPDQGILVYKNEVSKYEISIPNNWGYSVAEEDEVFESRVEILPPEGELKVTSINIDVAKFGAELAELYSDEEFKKWDEVESDTDVKGITKLGEDDVSGQKVLLLADLTKVGNSPTENSWSILGWFRKDERNFYVRMFGKQNFEEADEQVFQYLLGTMNVD